MKLISVIIPCYNAEKYLDRCIDSLVNQTLGIDNMELIFVNDASTDATFEKLCQWETKYPESILVVNCERNGKQGTARNIGIRYATTDYIGFVDADDWIDLNMYQKMYDKTICTGADVVGVLSQRVDDTGQALYVENAYKGPLDTFCEVTDDDYFRGLAGGVWSGLYKKQLILENDIWFPERLLYEDNYWGHILNYYIKSWYIIGEPLYNYYFNPNSTTTQMGLQHLDRLPIEIMKLEELKKRGFYDKDKERIEFNFVHLYYFGTLHGILVKMKELPYDTLRQMQRELCERFPDFENNPYVLKVADWQKALLHTARLNMTNEDWDYFRDTYLKAWDLPHPI